MDPDLQRHTAIWQQRHYIPWSDWFDCSLSAAAAAAAAWLRNIFFFLYV